MAFKKKEYKYWHKFFHHLVFKNGCNPYLIKNEFFGELITDEDYEGAKAADEVFNEWFLKFGLSEKQTSEYLDTFFKAHPVYGTKARS